jgi:hypothetical protein
MIWTGGIAPAMSLPLGDPAGVGPAWCMTCWFDHGQSTDWPVSDSSGDTDRWYILPMLALDLETEIGPITSA